MLVILVVIMKQVWTRLNSCALMYTLNNDANQVVSAEKLIVIQLIKEFRLFCVI
jgi:hypothetical protein